MLASPLPLVAWLITTPPPEPAQPPKLRLPATGAEHQVPTNVSTVLNAEGINQGQLLSSPIIAAMFGLAGGSDGVADPALTLYGHLGSSSLYDVTSGGNGWCDGEGAAACGDPNTLAATHDYVTGGVTDTITLTVTDNYGQTSTASHSVTVS
jgi:hypothetical protein